MTGEALTTQMSLTAGLLQRLLRSVLERRNAELTKNGEELGAGEAGDLGRPFLSDTPQLVPLHGGSQPQLADEILGIGAKRGQGFFRHVDCHVDHSWFLFRLAATVGSVRRCHSSPILPNNRPCPEADQL